MKRSLTVAVTFGLTIGSFFVLIHFLAAEKSLAQPITSTTEPILVSLNPFYAANPTQTNNPPEPAVTLNPLPDTPIPSSAVPGSEELFMIIQVAEDWHECTDLTAGSAITVTIGARVFYCYTVFNLNPVVTYTFHTVVDDVYGLLLFEEPYDLPPNEAVILLMETNMISTTVNQATWTAVDGSGTVTATATAAASVTVIDPGPNIVVHPPSIHTTQLPDSIYTQTVTINNTGFSLLTWNLAACSGTVPTWLGISQNSGQLLPNESTQIAVTLDSNQLPPNSYTSTLCLNSNDPDTPQIIIPVSLTVVTEFSLQFTFTKTVGIDPHECATTKLITVDPGTEVTYCYVINNTGQIPLTHHDVEDTALGVIVEGFPYLIAPGEIVPFILTTPISQTTVSTTTWSAAAANGESYSVNDVATVLINGTGNNSIVNLRTTVGLDPNTCAATDHLVANIPASGLAVTYCFVLTNEGTEPFVWHNLADNLHGTVMGGQWHILHPGDSLTLLQTTVITAPITNVTTWHAYNGSGVWGMTTDTTQVLSPQAIYLPVVIR